MDIHYLASPYFTNNGKIVKRNYESRSRSGWAKLSLWHQEKKTILLKYRISSYYQKSQRQIVGKFQQQKGGKNARKRLKKKGAVAGAVALIIGTSIGSGILALPQKTSLAHCLSWQLRGLIPSSIAMTMCSAFLLIEALLLVEINVGLLKRNKVKFEESELEVISIRTMAEETLGEWGGALATVTYVFLGYTSMIAYISKSGEILCHLINIPESVLGFLFTSLFTILISVGGTKAIDQVNQWLTALMIGLLVAIEVLIILYGGWSGDEGSSDWGEVPPAIPVLIFSLVYHDLAPVLCAYLEGDLKRIRASVLIGGLVPLLALLVWDAIAFGLSSQGEMEWCVIYGTGILPSSCGNISNWYSSKFLLSFSRSNSITLICNQMCTPDQFTGNIWFLVLSA
ncbi:tyrosine-specific transport system [Capsicum galapagoense]